jgi:hypothetical protein
VKLVIADDHKRLRAATRRVFNATHQRCRIRWMRNALAHARAKQRTAVAAMLKTIFAQETKVEAEAQWEIVAEALREKQPKLGALMDAARDDVLAYMSFPREHWTQIASTNPLERVNREVKQRADVIGIFPNPRPSSASSARSPLCSDQWRTMAHCWKPTTNGLSRGDTRALKPSPASPTIPPSGCPPWPLDQALTSPRVGAPTPRRGTLSINKLAYTICRRGQGNGKPRTIPQSQPTRVCNGRSACITA